MDYVILRTHVQDHERFLEAGPYARDLWSWGMLYAGKHETDGELPMAAVLASPWGHGGKSNVKDATKLVEVGLWERTDRGFRIRKWAEQGNKTKGQIEAAREAWRSKKKGQRSRPPSDVPPPECPTGTPLGTPSGVLNSTSTSLSGSGSLGGAGGEPPEWFAGSVETVEVQTGEKLRPSEAWLRYSGHRRNKGMAPSPTDAVYWLTTVMVPEARKERRADSDKRERDAKFDAERAKGKASTFRPPDTPPAPYHQAAPRRREERSDPKHAAGAIADVMAALNPKREAS